MRAGIGMLATPGGQGALDTAQVLLECLRDPHKYAEQVGLLDAKLKELSESVALHEIARSDNRRSLEEAQDRHLEADRRQTALDLRQKGLDDRAQAQEEAHLKRTTEVEGLKKALEDGHARLDTLGRERERAFNVNEEAQTRKFATRDDILASREQAAESRERELAVREKAQAKAQMEAEKASAMVEALLGVLAHHGWR